MLVNVEERDLCALLVGMEVGSAAVENSKEGPHRIKNVSTMSPSNSTSGCVPKGKEIRISHDICTPCLFTLLTVAKRWKKPKCPSTDEWIKKMWHITMKYY